MSGSSLDGLDMAWVEFSGDLSHMEWHLHAGQTIALPPKIKERFRDVKSLTAHDLAFLDMEFCKWMSDCISQFIKRHSCPIDYVASHGHTLFHHPDHGYTVQLGNGGYIAGRTGVDTIADFRTTDVACGGQGAPFAPIADKHLFTSYTYLLNLGGIANITSNGQESTVAFDICACNQVLNYLAGKKDLPYDDGGKLAKQGKVDIDLLQAMDQIDYYQKPPPKSIDNSWVSTTYFPILDTFTSSIEDKLATVTHHIANQIDNAIQTLGGPDGTLMISGGGAFNTFLIDTLNDILKGRNIDVVIPNDDVINYKEAILIAFMGYLRAMDVSNVLPSVTGASRPTISGAIYRGS